jgi:protein O-mannosyl-transferase
MVQVKTVDRKTVEEEISFKKFFLPFTPLKAIHYLILIGLIIYLNVLFNGFVADDYTFIISAPGIHAFNIITLFGVNIFNSDGYYRPIPAVYFSVLWNLFGDSTFFYHLLQIVLHIVTTCLLFYFFKKFFTTRLSFFLSLIFLIHPIQVESVAYIGSTQSELFSLFGIGGMLVGFKNEINRKSLLLISFLLLLSLLTKETGFLFLLMLLCFWMLYDRMKIFTFIPYLIGIVAVYSVIRFVFAKVFLVKITTTPLGILPLTERFMSIPAIVFYYTKTFFYPDYLAIDQQWSVTAFTLQHFYFPLFVDILFFILLIVGGVYILKKRNGQFRPYLFFFVWFVIGLGLLIQIFPLDFTVSDRWFYFPIIGLLGLLGILLQSVRIPISKKIVMSLAVILVVLLSIRTMVRNTNFVNEMTLYTHDAKNSYELENLLGNRYLQENDFKEAKLYYERSIAIWPCSDAHNNLGYLYQMSGKLSSAEQEYLQSVKCNGDAKSYGNLVVLLYKMHDYSLAMQYTRQAIMKYPENAGLYFILGVLEDQKGDRTDALRDLTTGYQLSHDPQIKKAIDEVKNNKKVDLPI